MKKILLLFALLSYTIAQGQTKATVQDTINLRIALPLKTLNIKRTFTEVNRLAGKADSVAASAISLLAGKANLAGGNTFTGTQSFPSTTSIGNVSATEIGYVDGVTSGIQGQLDSKVASNNGTMTGTTTTGTLKPAANGTSDLGAPTEKYLNGFINRVNALGTLTLISSGSNPILFSTSGPTSGVHGGFSDSKLILQSPGTSLTASTGELFQNNGTFKSTGNATFGSNVTMLAIPAMATKPAGVLVADGSGNISSRTNAQHFADITEIQNYRRTAFFEATGNGTATSIIGLLVSTQGTTTTRNVAATNFYTSLRRLGYVGATTANAPAGLTGNNAQFQVARGFSFRAVFAIQAYDAGHRYFVGMGETTDNTVDPSALVNRLHMYADPGDVTWKIRGANASQGTAVDLGANFPVNTSATDVYDVTFNCEPGATTATYLVKRLNTGDTASGTISTVPGAVLIRPQVIGSNAATGTAASVDIARIILVTDN